MEHITTRYGQPANLLKMKEEDFWKLKDFLAELGVQIRMCQSYNGECIIQGQNLGVRGAAEWHN